ncbi:MAG: adenosylmethionine decarboxylase [Candidatus Meridianibacter frigidus]|nr:MAG: adenosylmethionine decarboxylase [Candidatus Eremiobacteraeota bacterium]
MKALGTHIVCELSGCDPALLSDVDGVREHLKQAARKSKATIMETAFHRFFPQGVSGVVVLAESHISIHTWPETGYAAMDFYTCGDHTDPWLACEYAAQAFRATNMSTTEVKRGIEAAKGQFTHLITTDRQARELCGKSA